MTPKDDLNHHGGGLDGVLLASLARARSESQFRDLLNHAADITGIRYFSYGWLNHPKGPYGIANYPPAWQARYFEKNYGYIDPVIHECMTRNQPFDWSELDWSGKHVREFLADSKAHGVGPRGFTIPLKGEIGQLGVLSVSDAMPENRWGVVIDFNRGFLERFARALNDRIVEVNQDPLLRGDIKLSKREAEAATLVGMGYTQTQAADILNISAGTFRDHLDKLRIKMNARNVAQAVAKAAQAGMIKV